MPAFSSIFLVIALVLAVVIGPQTRPWTWGPAMAALGISSIAALPVFWKRGKSQADFELLALGALTAGWFAWRAWISPVAESGQADLLLVGGVLGAFASIRAISGNALAERILSWGIALLLLANVVVIGKQILDPGFVPVFRAKGAVKMVSGFLTHYNETANYLIASSMLAGAAALFGRHAHFTRVLWILTAVAGLAGVWFTRSRGGIFGAAVACGVFAAIALMIGKRRNARWFVPTLIAVPVIGLAIGGFLFVGWQQAQEVRQAGNDIGQMMDNTIRLYLLGIAMSCIGLHPWSGGGSRSFSWECYGFWEKEIQGAGGARPELVHNELMQAATDYGIVGAGLLAGLLGALAVCAVVRIIFEETPDQADTGDAWRIGALAALAGMMVQSCFSFVFHLIPGILLLGICLGQMSRSAPRVPNLQSLGARVLLSIAAISCAVLLLPAGWKGIQVTRILWATYFGDQALVSVESRIDALTEAIHVWPQSAFHQDRAVMFQKLEGSGNESAERAIEDFRVASVFQPFDPGPAINLANILSQLQRDSEAETWYAKAIQLQGGMEPGFRAHFSLAKHYLQKGLRTYRAEDPEPAHAALELAAEHMEIAAKKMRWITGDMCAPRVSIHENLGTAREAMEDHQGALESYNFAANLVGGSRAHYRAGVLIGKMAVKAWSDRKPSEALSYFMEARKRVGLATELPQGATPSQRAEYIAYLDRTIEFLKGAKVEPVK